MRERGPGPNGQWPCVCFVQLIVGFGRLLLVVLEVVVGTLPFAPMKFVYLLSFFALALVFAIAQVEEAEDGLDPNPFQLVPHSDGLEVPPKLSHLTFSAKDIHFATQKALAGTFHSLRMILRSTLAPVLLRPSSLYHFEFRFYFLFLFFQCKVLRSSSWRPPLRRRIFGTFSSSLRFTNCNPKRSNPKVSKPNVYINMYL